MSDAEDQSPPNGPGSRPPDISEDVVQPVDTKTTDIVNSEIAGQEEETPVVSDPKDPDTALSNIGSNSDLQRTMIAEISGTGVGNPNPPEATVISTERQKAVGTVQIVEPGTLINNNYRISSLVSSGGMGEVYRAENVFTGDPVAVKVVLSDLSQDEMVLDMFRREARVLVQLRDEAIVRYHNFVLDGGLNRYCLIMEFVEGRHLGVRVKEDGPLADDPAILLFNRLAHGLERAHARGVTHRDLSPDNVILRDDRIDEAVLIDFGIARSTELGDGLEGRFAGKFKYIAPEQLGHFGGVIAPATDVYGLALLMAMILRGKPLDMGDSIVSASAARQAIPDLSGVSHRLFPLLQLMLEPDPQRRPATMREVRLMLNDPTLIPAQYRLPLWSAARSVDAESELTDSFSALMGNTGEKDSSSPFWRPPDTTPQGQAQVMPVRPEPSPSRRRVVLFVSVGLALTMAVGLGLWLSMRDKGEIPSVGVLETEVINDLPARDTTTREGFLASLPLPECSFADRIATGSNAGMVAVFSDAVFETESLAADYEKKFGTTPTIIDARIAPAHCPTIEFLQEIAGRGAASPDLSATIRLAEEGYQIVGSVSAEAARNLWLFLVSPEGGVYDLSGQITDSAGARRFGVGISAVSANVPSDVSPFLLVALTTDKPVSAVAAAPAGAASAELMPLVLDDLRANKENPGASVVALRVAEGEPSADPESTPGDGDVGESTVPSN